MERARSPARTEHGLRAGSIALTKGMRRRYGSRCAYYPAHHAQKSEPCSLPGVAENDPLESRRQWHACKSAMCGLRSSTRAAALSERETSWRQRHGCVRLQGATGWRAADGRAERRRLEIGDVQCWRCPVVRKTVSSGGKHAAVVWP